MWDRVFNLIDYAKGHIGLNVTPDQNYNINPKTWSLICQFDQFAKSATYLISLNVKDNQTHFYKEFFMILVTT